MPLISLCDYFYQPGEGCVETTTTPTVLMDYGVCCLVVIELTKSGPICDVDLYAFFSSPVGGPKASLGAALLGRYMSVRQSGSIHCMCLCVGCYVGQEGL